MNKKELLWKVATKLIQTVSLNWHTWTELDWTELDWTGLG